MQHLPRKLLRLILKTIVSIIIFAAIFVPFSLPLFSIILLGSALFIQVIAIALDLIGLPQKATFARYWHRKILAPIIKIIVEFLRKYRLHQAILGAYMYKEAANFYFTAENAKTVFHNNGLTVFFFLQTYYYLPHAQSPLQQPPSFSSPKFIKMMLTYLQYYYSISLLKERTNEISNATSNTSKTDNL